MPTKHLKYVAEYVNDAPQAGCVADIEDTELLPLTPIQTATISRIRRTTTTAGRGDGVLPPTELVDQFAILMQRFTEIREVGWLVDWGTLL